MKRTNEQIERDHRSETGYLRDYGKAVQETAFARRQVIDAIAAVHARWAPEKWNAGQCMVEIGRILAEAKVVK